MAEAGLAQGVQVLFFSPYDIRPKKRTVPGVIWTPNGWEWSIGPLPNVIIDNVYVHIASTDATFKENKRLLRKSGHIVLNPRLPDKWGVWSTLLEHPHLQPNLPDTALLRPDTPIDQWLHRHGNVFLKPTRGSGGRGILQLQQQHSSRNYLLTHDNLSETIKPHELNHRLRQHLAQGNYLIQQGLSLLEIDKRRVDIRIVLHRDGNKHWQPIATVPRLGGTGQILTNLEQGGETRTLDWLSDQAKRLGIHLQSRAAIEQVALESALAMTKIRPTLAFLGIDIAPDTSGNLWLLDINPRPGRKVLSDADKRHAFHCLLGYSKTLHFEKPKPHRRHP